MIKYFHGKQNNQGRYGMTVYLDIVFIENTIINFFLLQVTFHCLNVNSKLNRMVISSMIGGVYSFTLIFNKLYFLTYMPFKLAIGFFMVYLCIGSQPIRLVIKGYLFFIMCAILLAGMLVFLQLNCGDFQSACEKQNFSIKALIFSLMLIYIFTYRIIHFIKSRITTKELIYDVDISVSGKTYRIKGFWDTGNDIYEPATMLPVIVVEENIFKSISVNELSPYKIPYKAFKGQRNYLTGFKPECIKIHIGDKWLEKKAIIALCNTKLNNLNDYNALLSREIL